ncbi:MAG: nucleotide exchange factor GrpE [Patescibacteria group bacterium]
MEDLQQKILELEKQAAENLSGWQRAQADYANLRKENEKRGMEIFEIANAAFMAEILPVYNHFKLALKHIPEEQKDQDWIKGILQIQKQFQDFLKKYDIKEIPTVGEKFNPNFHEAVTHEEKEGVEPETVFEEVMPGYTLSDKILNPAKVKVGK